MKTAIGNDKLGKNCIVVSRPVGDTCPSTCQFLGNGCYAEATERQYKNARVAGFANLITEKGRIRSMIIDAQQKGRSIRLQERGDFELNGKLDVEYVENLRWACESIVKTGGTLPKIWAYTHVYDRRLVDSLGPYISLFASVHNEADMATAKAAGFTKFAWCDSEGKIAPKRPKSKAKADTWRASLPKLVVLGGERFVTCPEIRKGRSFVTCTGSKDSQACKMCLSPEKPNVLFPAH